MKLKKSNRFFSLLIGVTLGILLIIYFLLSAVHHTRFQSGGLDLGLYDQAVWQYSRFLLPYNTVKERFILGDHLNLTLPLISPLYYFLADVKILLFFQCFWIIASGLAIYKLGLFRKFSPFVSYILTLLYLLFYGMQFLLFFDFHPIALGIGLLVWFVYFFETKKTRLMLIALILAFLTQENMGIAVAGVGLIYLFRRDTKKAALILIITGLLVSFLASRIIGLFSPVGFQYQPGITLNPVKNIIGLFDAPEKRLVWLYSFSWYSFLPLLSPGALLAVILDLAQYFVTGKEFMRMWSPFMHHRAILSVFLVLGSLDALQFLKKRKINPGIIASLMLLVTLSLQFYFHFPLNKLSKKEYWRYESWMADNEKLFAYIPRNESLAAQQSLVPHLAHRREIYLIWPRTHDFKNKICGQRSCWWLDFGGQPDYLVVDLHPHQWITQLLESNENFSSAIVNMEKSGKLTLVKAVNNAKLYKIHYTKED